MTGSLPTNSGIKPNFIKSSGLTCPISLSVSFSDLIDVTLAPNPIPVSSHLCWITDSSPENAPPQMKRMLEVSTCKNSCCGCFLPPCGGTEATVPSMSFNKACCTPSPETSLVIDGLSDFRAILSISSI